MSDAMNLSNDQITAPVKTLPSLSWTIHPFKRDWRVSSGILVILLLVPILTAAYVGSLALGIFFLIVMLVSLSRFFLPTTYRLNHLGIKIQSLTGNQERSWSQFRTAWPDKNGLLLSPFAGPSRLENFRGLYLIFDRTNRSEVLELTRYYLAIAGADVVVKSNPQAAASNESSSSR